MLNKNRLITLDTLHYIDNTREVNIILLPLHIQLRFITEYLICSHYNIISTANTQESFPEQQHYSIKNFFVVFFMLVAFYCTVKVQYSTSLRTAVTFNDTHRQASPYGMIYSTVLTHP